MGASKGKPGTTGTEGESPKSMAHSFMEEAYRRAGALRNSRERFNDFIRTAAQLAITDGMEFGEDDVSRIAKLGYTYNEDDYRLAVEFRGGPNTSFCRAFERYAECPAFIVKDEHHPSGRRVAVGSDLEWYGERRTVTSFGHDERGHFLRAASYADGFGRNDTDRWRLNPGAEISYYATRGDRHPERFRRTIKSVTPAAEAGAEGSGELIVVLGEEGPVEYEARRPTDILRISLEDVREHNRAVVLAREALECTTRLYREGRGEAVKKVVLGLNERHGEVRSVYQLRLPQLQELMAELEALDAPAPAATG